MAPAVIRRPGYAVVLQRTGTAKRINNLEGRMGFVGTVRPESMVAGRDGHFTEHHQYAKPYPFKTVIAVSEAVPGNKGYRYQDWHGQNQKIKPAERGFAGDRRL